MGKQNNLAEKGIVVTCADRRFHRQQHEKFEEETGLRPDQYWIRAEAGGAPAIADDDPTVKHAVLHGAVHMGWGAHGSNCGGCPGKSDEEIEAMLDEKIAEMKEKYPNAKHHKLFSKE